MGDQVLDVKGTAGNNAAAAPSAATSNAPDPATSGAPADTGSNVDDLDKPVIPRRRLNEELEEKKHYKSLAEDYKQKMEALEQRIAAGEKPPADPVDDVLTDPDGFVNKRINNEVGSLKQDITELKRERIENAIGEQYGKDPVMQKVFKDKKELFNAIGKTAAKYGAKELTPQVIHAAYQQLIVDNREGDLKIAREMGIEEERAKAKALDGSTVPFGSSPGDTVRSKKPTKADLEVWKKMGRNVDEMTKKLENAEYDERGVRRINRGGKNG